MTNDALAEAMYAQYREGLSIAQVAEQWQRTRQTGKFRTIHGGTP